jgi:hypothetical protein
LRISTSKKVAPIEYIDVFRLFEYIADNAKTPEAARAVFKSCDMFAINAFMRAMWYGYSIGYEHAKKDYKQPTTAKKSKGDKDHEEKEHTQKITA